MTDGSVTSSNSASQRTIDAALLRSIVREVLERVQRDAGSVNETAIEEADGVVVDDRVVTVATIEQHAGQNRPLLLNPSAVVTPAAWDVIRQRSLCVQRRAADGVSVSTYPRKAIAGEPTAAEPAASDLNIFDCDDSSRGRAVANQLRQRGCDSLSVAVVLSETPAAEVCRRCSDGRRAVMVSCINDVPRFAAECDPTDWVLDMKRLNLVAATNVAMRVSQITQANSTSE